MFPRLSDLPTWHGLDRARPATKPAETLLFPHSLQLIKETGKGNTHAAAVTDDGRALGHQPGHREGHSDAMVAVTLDFRAAQSLLPRHAQAVREFLDL